MQFNETENSIGGSSGGDTDGNGNDSDNGYGTNRGYTYGSANAVSPTPTGKIVDKITIMSPLGSFFSIFLLSQYCQYKKRSGFQRLVMVVPSRVKTQCMEFALALLCYKLYNHSIS